MSGKPKSKPRTIKVDYLARVEGEGALYLKIRDGAVADVKLKIFEPPRFFEAFLRGRRWTEAPDITARICGICPIAYIASSISAMESIAGIEVPEGTRQLRRLIYCGEWIESHVLHVAMLHAPDFLGFEDAIQMAGKHPEVVQNALRLKKLGNTIMEVVGGRAVHPINLRVGGFYRLPAREELDALIPELEWGMQTSAAFARFTAGLEFPALERDYDFAALRHPCEYPLWDAPNIAFSSGREFPFAQFLDYAQEHQVAHSTSLHAAKRDGGTYAVGPLARFAINFDRLSPASQALARECGLDSVCRNPFKSIVVRSIETYYACEEAIRLIRAYTPPAEPFVPATPRAGVGFGCSEAPRGICWHRYAIDDTGAIKEARIIPPTSQNQRVIEEDVAALVPLYLDLPDEDLEWKCEQAIRNYDPCISCSCHFLKLEVDRG